MRGAILCEVNDSEAGRDGLDLAAELGDRLGMRLAAEHGHAGSAEQRSAVGDPVALLGQIAAEEAAT